MYHLNLPFELKIAYRNILKRPLRTIFTVIAISLGVSLFFSVNIAADSLEHSIYAQFEEGIGDADQWVYLFRGILMVLSAISLIVCVIIIKNLIEMSKEDQLYELGLLRAIGTSKKSIFLIFFFQNLIIISIGVILGLFFGLFISFLFFDPLKFILSGFVPEISDSGLIVQIHISDVTILSSIFAGLIIPILIGLIPTVSAARHNVLFALNPHSQANKFNKNHITSTIVQFIISMSFISIGIIIINFGFSRLLSFTSNPTMETNIAIILLFFAGLIFICGSILLGAIFLPYISFIFSNILNPFLLKMKKISYRNLIKNRRRTKNIFLMISIGLSFLITVSIIVKSINAGIVPGAHMRLGGDICIGRYWTGSNGYQCEIPLNTSNDISQLPQIKDICEIKNSDFSVNKTTCDAFGTREGERLILYVINTSSYVRMHSSASIVQYQGAESFYDFMYQLEFNRTIILQEGLLNKIQKSEGEKVNVETVYSNYLCFPSMTANLTIVGIMNKMPGIDYTWNEDLDPDYEYYAAIISWNTYFNITGESPQSSHCNFWINCDYYYQANDACDEIANLYQTLGSPWNKTSFNREDYRVRTILDEISLVSQILDLVFVVIVSILLMALIISMLGLVSSMIMSVNQRRSEIGIFRSIGISKYQVLQMVFGETLIICASTLITGIICGISTAFLLSTVPFMAYAPIIFTLHWLDIIYISFFMVSLSLLTSIIPAIKALRLNIIDAIRKRGM